MKAVEGLDHWSGWYNSYKHGEVGLRRAGGGRLAAHHLFLYIYMIITDACCTVPRRLRR